MEEEQWAPNGERKRLRREEGRKGQDEWNEAEGFCERARKAAGPIRSRSATFVLRSVGSTVLVPTRFCW